jgi:hypothetical protein
MGQSTISQVARQIRLRPSAIRYCERIGLLPLAQRVNGQRRYDSTVLYRLAIIQRARARFYVECNPTHVLWFPRCHSRFGTLANSLPKKACGVGSSDGGNKSSARLAQEVDEKVPMRHLGSMWQGHVSENEQRCSRYAPPWRSSTPREICVRVCAPDLRNPTGYAVKVMVPDKEPLSGCEWYH